MGRTIILGLDGVPYGLVRDLTEQGVMPHLKRLRETGVFTKLESTVPDVSSVAWSTIITGQNPGEHGIYGFTDIIEGTYSISYHNSRKLRSRPFWQKHPEQKHVILNLPASYPASELNGVMVAGFVAPDLEKAVYPRSYLEKLKAFDYRIDIDAEKARKSNRLLFKKLFEVFERRVKAYRYFWEKIAWDTFMLVFTGTDRLGHYLWNAYGDEDHEYHEKFLEFFSRIDTIIGEIDERMEEDDALVLLSDHGMERIKANVNVNAYLAREGFLHLDDTPNKGFNNIKEGTQAFSLDPGRIYLNKRGKYPKGSVSEEQEEAILTRLEKSLKRLKNDGEPVINTIYRKEELYDGAHVENAPDLVALSHSGFKLKGGLLKDQVFEKPPLSGKHTRDDAFILIKNGNDDIIPKNPSLEDFRTIINRV